MAKKKAPAKKKVAKTSAVKKTAKNLPDLNETDLSKPSLVTKSLNESSVTNSIGMQFKMIPAGDFTMGLDKSLWLSDPYVGCDEGYAANETIHDVSLTRTFHLGIHQVTQSQYKEIMGNRKKLPSYSNGNNPSYYKGADRPVECVLWREAVEFCNKLSRLPSEKKAGNTYRLPTEAEWEYACRAGTSTIYHFTADPLVEESDSSETPKHFKSAMEKARYEAQQLNWLYDWYEEQEHLLDDYAWFGMNSNDETHPVGQKKPNPWGLFDMYGNVQEWCSDWLASFDHNDSEDPTGPASKPSTRSLFKVNRGGFCKSRITNVRSSIRGYGSTKYAANSDCGFRVVLETTV